jgi:hypothetical protein
VASWGFVRLSFVRLGHALCTPESALPLLIRNIAPAIALESSAVNTLISKDLIIYRRPAAARNGPCHHKSDVQDALVPTPRLADRAPMKSANGPIHEVANAVNSRS